MIANRHITKIVAVIMTIAVCLCLAAMLFTGELVEALGGTSVAVEYESKLFDTDEPMTVDILIDETDWEDMLANATDEVYYQCDVEINGEMVYKVGIRPKGNTSLTTIASDPTTDRYSFKLEFDQYVDGQTCYCLLYTSYNNAAPNVAFKNFFHVFRFYLCIHDLSRINHHQRSLVAQTHTAGLYHFCFFF